MNRNTIRSWNEPEKRLYWAARNRAQKLNLVFDLHIQDIIIPEYCPVLGLKLEHHREGKGPQANSPSVDRINPQKGYTKDNIQIISHKANRMKQNATPKELLKFAFWVYRNYLTPASKHVIL